MVYISLNKCSVLWKEKRTNDRPLIYHLWFIILYAHSPNDNLPPRMTRYIAHSDITIVIGSPIIAQPNISALKTSGNISFILLFPVVSIDSRAEKFKLIESAVFVFAVAVIWRAFYGIMPVSERFAHCAVTKVKEIWREWSGALGG